MTIHTTALLTAAMLAGSAAQAGTLFSEDFEGLTLQDSFLASDNDNETDWTATGPAGWTSDYRTTPVATDPVLGDTLEFQGWVYLDQQFWLNQQGDQAGRSQFAGFANNPNNTILVVDPDAHDDFVDNDPNLFTAVVSTPVIDLTGVEANTVNITFDSSWVPEDLQEGHFNVLIDGVRQNLFVWDSEANANFKAAAPNETISIDIANTAGGTVQFEWDMVEAGNDWWWAIDNVQVATVPEPGSLALLGLGGLAMLRRGR